MWVKCSSFATQGLFGSTASSGHYTRLFFNNSSTLLLYDNANNQGLLAGLSMTTGVWNHIAIAVDTNKSAIIYVNNAATTVMSVGGFSGSWEILGFGGIGGGSPLPTSCVIDEVGFWNGTKLTAGNVSTLYNGGAGLAY